MDTYNKYAALADTIQIKDITSNKDKQNILKKLKDNDANFNQMWISDEDQVIEPSVDYDFDSAEELGWLGYYIGQNTSLEELNFRHSPPASYHRGIEVFRRGIGHNNSIKTLSFGGEFSFGGSVLPMLDTFLKNNNNLSDIDIECCEFGVEDARQLSLALGGCNKSLKHFRLYESNLQDGQLVDIITALSMHPQLTVLRLSHVNIGTNECSVLSTLLRWTTTKLRTLNLHGNSINDEELEVLVDALANINTLGELNLPWNQTITIKGWKVVSTLLEMPGSKLEALHIHHNNIGDEGGLIFVKALAKNTTLQTLSVHSNGITREGWAPFSKLLCDTSSVNKTFMSNHTLTSFGSRSLTNVTDSQSLLALNRIVDKQHVAITKILQNHSHFDMQPFFEWDFKVLPIMVEWFTKASTFCTIEYEEKIKKMRLSAVYDFIREFPMLYVEARTREEIKKHTSLEMQIQRAQLRLQREQMQLASQLEEVQQCKARAMRRL